MIDFDFCAPTRIIFGKGKATQLPTLLNQYGLDNILLIYGGHHAKASGLYDQVTSLLKEGGITWCELEGIRPNPTRQEVLKGVEIARSHNVNGILALGGGSVIDVAKSVGHGFYYDGDPFDFNLHKVEPCKSLPVGVILTFGSAGSEMSDSCVIQDDETKKKAGFNHPTNRCLFAIEDPSLSFSVPPYQKAAAIADICMHSLERYFAPSDEYQLSDAWALALVKSTIEAGKVCIEDPTNYNAHATLMLNSSLSHNGYTGLGKPSSWVVHPLEHALSGYFPSLAHGAGIALIYPAWARYVYKKNLSKFARIASDVFNIKKTNEETMAIIGIDEMEKFFISINLPSSGKDIGTKAEDVPYLANLASENGTRAVGRYPQPLDRQDIENIFNSLLI